MGWFFGSNANKDEDNSHAAQNDVAPQNNYQVQTHYSSYSSSRACQSDPEDNEYLICKEKVYQNGKQQIRQQRVHVNDAHFGNQFGGFFDMFSNIFKGVDQGMSFFNQHEKQFKQDFDRIQASFIPFVERLNRFNPDINQHFDNRSRRFQNFPHDTGRNKQNYGNNQNWKNNEGQYENKGNKKSHYFSTQDRDYQIRDL